MRLHSPLLLQDNFEVYNHDLNFKLKDACVNLPNVYEPGKLLIDHCNDDWELSCYWVWKQV